MTTPKKRGPQICGRILKTEVFLRTVAAKVRARAESHNLMRSRPEDEKAGEKLRELSAQIDRLAAQLREPELPFSP